VRSGLHTLINIVLGISAVVVVVVGVVLFLGRSSGALGDELVFVTRVVEIDVANVAAVGNDAFVAGGPLAERTLDVIALPLADARVHAVYADGPPPGLELLVVRDPIRFGGLAPLLTGHTLVAAVEPLLDPTQDFLIDFQARLVVLDRRGEVIGSDWEGESSDQLGRLLAWGRSRGFGPGETLAMAARAMVAPTGSDPEREILDIIDG
jgi:hypothetical protein